MPFRFLSVPSIFSVLPLFALDFGFLSITVRALNGHDISSAPAFHTSGAHRGRERGAGGGDFDGGRVAKFNFTPTSHPVSFVLCLCLSVLFGKCLVRNSTLHDIQTNSAQAFNICLWHIEHYTQHESFLLLHLSNH